MIRRAAGFGSGALLLLALHPSAVAEPGSEATATGNATVHIIAPLKLEAIAPLEFGTVTVPQGGWGTITIAASGAAPTYSGGMRGLCAGSSPCEAHPAQFAVRGEPGRYYRVDYPPDALAKPVSGSGAALHVTGLTIATDSLKQGGARGLLDAAGKDGLRAGGTLEVPGGTLAGRYRATLNIVVAYD